MKHFIQTSSYSYSLVLFDPTRAAETSSKVGLRNLTQLLLLLPLTLNSCQTCCYLSSVFERKIVCCDVRYAKGIFSFGHFDSNYCSHIYLQIPQYFQFLLIKEKLTLNQFVIMFIESVLSYFVRTIWDTFHSFKLASL